MLTVLIPIAMCGDAKDVFLPPKMVLDDLASILGLHLQFEVPKSFHVEVSRLHVIFDLMGSYGKMGLLNFIHKCLPIPPLHLSLD